MTDKNLFDPFAVGEFLNHLDGILDSHQALGPRCR